MTETIVAIFDSAEHAALAVHDLETAGVPAAAITQHAKGGISTGLSTTTATPEPGFWASLFGSEPEHSYETSVYDRSMEAGSTVVTVNATEQHLDQVMDILEPHSPIDIDERAATYGDSQTMTTRTANPSPATGAPATRTEIVRDTVRREDVEITKEAADARARPGTAAPKI